MFHLLVIVLSVLGFLREKWVILSRAGGAFRHEIDPHCGAGPTEPRVGYSATYFYYTILLYANTKSLSKLYFVTGNEAKTKGA